MPSTFEPIASNTLTGTATSITFNSIPSAYTDLHIVAKIIAVSNDSFQMRINGIATAEYQWLRVDGDGANNISGSNSPFTNSIFLSQGFINATPSLFRIDINYYAISGFTKTILSTGNTNKNGAGNSIQTAGILARQNPISSLEFFGANANNLTTGTSISIYGITRA